MYAKCAMHMYVLVHYTSFQRVSHLPPGAVTQAPPISHATHPIEHHSQSGQSQQQQQQHAQPQQAFTFPSPEEMALQQQRLMALIQSGAIQVSGEPFPGAAMFPPGLYPAHLHPGHALTIEAISHLRPEDQAAAMLAVQQHAQAQVQAAQVQGQVPQFISGMVPPAFMEQFMAQQQQQQQAALAANVVVATATGGGLPGNIVPAENILELQRQYEGLITSIQKNPILAQSPQVHLAIERYHRILQEHQIQQQQRMHEAMIQNSQQHELHQQLLLARVPGGQTTDENPASRGIRTGVIVHPPN